MYRTTKEVRIFQRWKDLQIRQNTRENVCHIYTAGQEEVGSQAKGMQVYAADTRLKRKGTQTKFNHFSRIMFLKRQRSVNQINANCKNQRTVCFKSFV